MQELIDRHALLKKVYEHPEEREWMTDGEWHRKCIYEAPKVEAKPVKHGRWIPVEYDAYADGAPVWDKWECSECGHEHSGEEDTMTAFCPDCGSMNMEVSEMHEVRIIDANALKKDLSEFNYEMAIRIVDTQPTIEPEVRHGEWHECWHTDTVCSSICTNCGKAATQARVIVGQELMTNVRYPLCPNCGARMRVTDTNVGGKGGTENDT